MTSSPSSALRHQNASTAANDTTIQLPANLQSIQQKLLKPINTKALEFSKKQLFFDEILRDLERRGVVELILGEEYRRMQQQLQEPEPVVVEEKSSSSHNDDTPHKQESIEEQNGGEEMDEGSVATEQQHQEQEETKPTITKSTITNEPPKLPQKPTNVTIASLIPSRPSPPAVPTQSCNNNKNASPSSNTSSSSSSSASTDIHKIETRYFLACSLVKSPQLSDVRLGLYLLEEILTSNGSTKWNHKEVLFQVALSYYRISDIVQSKILCRKLLDLYPNYQEGKNLMKLLQYEVKEMRKRRTSMAMAQIDVYALRDGPGSTAGHNTKSDSSPIQSSSPLTPNHKESAGDSSHADGNQHNHNNSPHDEKSLAGDASLTSQVLDVEKLICPDEYKEILRQFSNEELQNLVTCFTNLTSCTSGVAVFDKEQFGESLPVLQRNDFTYQFLFNFFIKSFSNQHLRALALTGLKSMNESSTTVGLSQFLSCTAVLLRGSVELQLSLAFSVLDTDEKGYLTEDDIRTHIELLVSILQLLSLETIPVERMTRHIVKQLKDNSNVYRFTSPDSQLRISLEEFIQNGKKNYDQIIGLGIITKPYSGFTYQSTSSRRGVHSIYGSKNLKDLLNILIGIRLAQDMWKPLTRNMMPVDFSASVQFSLTHIKQQHTFIDYAPRVFKKIRSFLGVSEAEFLYSLSPEVFLGKLLLGSWSLLSENSSEGRSGACFYYTDDGKYLIKNIPSAESTALKRVLPIYYEHLKNYKTSFLVRYVSLFDFDKRSFCIMTNAFQTQREMHEIYDLKGSVVARSNPNGRVKKDMDLKHPINIGKEKRDRLLHVLWADIDTLLALKFTDYSLLLGIHNLESENSGDAGIHAGMDTAASGDNTSATASSGGDGVTHGGVSSPQQTSGASSTGSSTNNLRGKLTPLEQRHILQQERQVIHNGAMNFDLRDMMFEDGGILSVDGKHIYYLCIIDTLTEYTWTKSAERSLKTFKYGSGRWNQISAQPPDVYAQRLKAFIAKILV